LRRMKAYVCCRAGVSMIHAPTAQPHRGTMP